MVKVVPKDESWVKPKDESGAEPKDEPGRGVVAGSPVFVDNLRTYFHQT
jgi:hypothetical protein